MQSNLRLFARGFPLRSQPFTTLQVLSVTVASNIGWTETIEDTQAVCPRYARLLGGHVVWNEVIITYNYHVHRNHLAVLHNQHCHCHQMSSAQEITTLNIQRVHAKQICNGTSTHIHQSQCLASMRTSSYMTKEQNRKLNGHMMSHALRHQASASS